MTKTCHKHTKILRRQTTPGARAEHLAANYLIKQGLQLIESNYYSSCGEIDLIMRHNQTLVFVEVRHRSNSRYGGAAASITTRKLQKIRNTAYHYIQRRNISADTPVRVDALCVNGEIDSRALAFDWITDIVQDC